MYAGEYDDIRVRLGGSPGEPQRITYIIGDVLNVRFLIIVRQEHRVLFLLHLFDFLKQIQHGVDGCVDKTGLPVQYRNVHHNAPGEIVTVR